MRISVMPASTLLAARNDLKPSTGQVTRLIARWSCSAMLLRYLAWRTVIDTAMLRLAIKQVTKPVLNFKSFCSTGTVTAGIELIHIIRKGYFAIDGAEAMSIADQFSALAGIVRSICAM